MRKKKSPGPDAERLKLTGSWKDLVAKALGKKPPPGGWPKAKVRQK
jgi:hypothetical protein